MMKTTIIGLGLIGGSIAIDLRKAGLVTELSGIDSNPEHARQAVELGLVDEIDAERFAFIGDLIVLAIPVTPCANCFRRFLTLLRRMQL